VLRVFLQGLTSMTTNLNQHKHRNQQMHKFQVKGKIVEDDVGQFLKKCKFSLLKFFCVYSSYLDTFMVQISQSMGSRSGRYQQINLYSVYGKMSSTTNFCVKKKVHKVKFSLLIHLLFSCHSPGNPLYCCQQVLGLIS
jgi:hypothetical protein